MNDYEVDNNRTALRPIHLAVVLALVFHFMALATLAWYSPKSVKEDDTLRLVSKVSLVDSIKLPVKPPSPPPVKKTAVKPKAVKPHDIEKYAHIPKTSMNKYGAAPGKPGAPGDPAKKLGRGSGRVGLRTAIDPDMPKLGVSAFGGPGYPTGHGYGKYGDKFGKHSGFGEDGGGEGGEGGEGGVIVKDLIYVIEPDYTISVYDSKVDKKHYMSDEARIVDEEGREFIKVYLASRFNVTVINNCEEPLNFRFEGEVHHKGGYVGASRILDPYLWGNLAPGESRCVDNLVMVSGYRAATISHVNDPVGTFFNIEQMLFIASY
ncbi:MAG: hypothetical protein ACI38Q_08075 [Candidatus Bruticola sp.]